MKPAQLAIRFTRANSDWSTPLVVWTNSARNTPAAEPLIASLVADQASTESHTLLWLFCVRRYNRIVPPILKHRFTPILIGLLILLLLAGCSVNPVTGKHDFVLMSESQEIALGRQYSQQVLKEYRVYDNPTLQAYIQAVGDRVSRLSHRGDLYYRFTLLDSTQVNAFALPGGYIYITRGLLAYLNSEAQLAAVLGHEVGHVTARHSVRQQSVATATGLVGSILAAATGVQGADQLTQILGAGIVRGYGREQELEADRLGAEYLSRAGYNPMAMQDVIGVLKNQELFEQQLAREEGREARSYHGLFSTHPDNDTRLQTVVASAKKFQTGEVENRAEFLANIEGLTFGDSEQDGIRRGRFFYHGPLNFRLEFPQSWRFENRPAYLESYSPDGEWLMRVSMEDLNKRLTPRAFIQERLGMSDFLSEAPLNVNGLVGHQVVVNANTNAGKKAIRVAVIFKDQRAFIFLAESKSQAKFSAMDAQVQPVFRSFSALSKAERALAKETQLHVVQARSGQTFQFLAKESPITHHAAEQLMLLNGRYPAGNLKAGDQIKVVR